MKGEKKGDKKVEIEEPMNWGAEKSSVHYK